MKYLLLSLTLAGCITDPGTRTTDHQIDMDACQWAPSKDSYLADEDTLHCVYEDIKPPLN